MSADDTMREALKQKFQEKLAEVLTFEQWQRIETLLNNCENCSGKIISLLLYASEQGAEKFEEVIGLLEKLYDEQLQFHHPTVRGQVLDEFGVNRASAEFIRIYREVLGLGTDQ